MDFLKNSFTQSLNYLNPLHEDFFLKDLFNWLNPFSEKFILKQLWSFLTNIISYINPFSENFFGYKIIDMFKDLFNLLFVPKEDKFGDLASNIKSKFGFINQLHELVNTLFSLDNSPYVLSNDGSNPSNAPNWSITYFNTTVNIIDWSAFEKFRGVFHGIVIFLLWGSYLIRLYKRVPAIIYGFTEK